MLVRDLMTDDAVTVRVDTAVKAALATLAEHRITSVPVVDDEGRVRGILSEADLLRELVTPDPRGQETLRDEEPHDHARVVGEVMTPDPVTVTPSTDVAVVVERWSATGAKSVPVLDPDGRLVCVLSRSDVVDVLARSDQSLAAEVSALLAQVGVEGWSVEAVDGTVLLGGPDGSPQRALAHVVARTVAGVVGVRDS